MGLNDALLATCATLLDAERRNRQDVFESFRRLINVQIREVCSARQLGCGRHLYFPCVYKSHDGVKAHFSIWQIRIENKDENDGL